MKVESEKVNKLLPNNYYPLCKITELNELIYTGVELVSDKISVCLGNLNKNRKLGWEIRTDKETVTTSKSAKKGNAYQGILG